MVVVWLVIAFLIIVYILFLLFFSYPRAAQEVHSNNLKNPHWTIVVVFRNEEKTLATLLESIHQLEYRKSRIQLLLVDDHSTDKSKQCIENFKNQYDNQFLSIDYLAIIGEGKRQGLIEAKSLLKGSYALFTDADSILPSGLLKRYSLLFQKNDGIKLLAGPVVLNAPNSFQKLQSIEFSSLWYLSALMSKRKWAVLCSGANMAVESEQYLAYNGHEDLGNTASGDDVLLLNKYQQETATSVHFVMEQECIVESQSEPEFAAFYQQRKRWASKWKTYRGGKAQWISTLMGLHYLAMVVGFILCIFDYQALFVLLVVLKWGVDLIFISISNHFFAIKSNIFLNLVLVLIYPFYALYFGTVAQIGKYRWKGRVQT